MLSREDVVAVMARIFAVFLVVWSLRTLAQIIQLLSADAMSAASLALAALVFVAPLLAALVLWVFPLSVATRLLPVMKSARPPLTGNREELEQVGLSLLGAWVLVYALVDAVYWAFLLQRTRHMGLGWDDAIGPETFAGMVATGVELVLGVVLVLGARGIVGAFRRIRQTGS